MSSSRAAGHGTDTRTAHQSVASEVDMDHCGNHSSKCGAFLLSLLVLIGDVQATTCRHADAGANTKSARAARATTAAFVASGQSIGGVAPGRANDRRAAQHQYVKRHHLHVSRDAEDRSLYRKRGRFRRRPSGILGSRMAAAADDEDQQQQQQLQQLQEPKENRVEIAEEARVGGLSRASFVQTAAGSAAAVLALSLVSYVKTSRRWRRRWYRTGVACST